MRQVIVLGNDHTNTLGIAQCLGKSNYLIDAYVWGEKTKIATSSRFINNVYSATCCEDLIGILIKNKSKYKSNKIPIIACCDTAAVTLEKYKDRLSVKYIFEYTTGPYSLRELSEKDLQVKLAIHAGFNVPCSLTANINSAIPQNVKFDPPYIFKPLVSAEGAKSDITICENRETLLKKLAEVKLHTQRLLIQQYIERDYEISILGCGLSNGECIIPAVEDKLTLYPKYRGLECLTRIHKLEDKEIISSIKKIISTIGYVGLFSVEMMHNKNDNKFYFTEINLRNDGANSFIFKYGVNLPLAHILDLKQIKGEYIEEKLKPGYYIWDMHHFRSLMCGDISILTWFKELKMSNGFMTYFPDDRKPFFRQYINLFLKMLRRGKPIYY